MKQLVETTGFINRVKQQSEIRGFKQQVDTTGCNHKLKPQVETTS